jgi:hypothetical protein
MLIASFMIQWSPSSIREAAIFILMPILYFCPMEEAFHFSSVLEESTNKLWGCHFSVPKALADTLIGTNDSRRVVCVLNGKIEHQCALLPHGDGTFVITVNKKIQTQLGLKFGVRINVSLRKDESEYGLPMPEELAELLAQDEEGDRLFHALTPGKLRTLLYLVGQPKSSDIRLHRALVVVEHLKTNQGKIDYKKLNLAVR